MEKKEFINDILELGKFYFLNEKYDEAIQTFQRCIDLDPQLAQAYYNLGLVYETKNEHSLAKEMYRKAVELDPKFNLAQEHLERLVGN